MLKAVIFDMDGVLINSEPLHYEADMLLLDHLGCELDYEYYKQFIGSTSTHLWNTLKGKFGLKQSTDELCQMAGKHKREILAERGYPIIDGVKEMVEHFHQAGLLLAVASSSSPVYIEEVTIEADIRNAMKELVSGETVEHPKPAPDVFLKAAKLLGVLPDECIVIEDSKNGTKAAKAAGMACIGYMNPDSGDQDLSMADYLIESYDVMNVDFLKMVYAHATGKA